LKGCQRDQIIKTWNECRRDVAKLCTLPVLNRLFLVQLVSVDKTNLTADIHFFSFCNIFGAAYLGKIGIYKEVKKAKNN
jgi:hypothetical protein